MTATQPIQVLLVDDDVLVQRATARMLRHAGLTVVTATSRAEALEVLGEGRRFDVVLSDYQLDPPDRGDLLFADIEARFPSAPMRLVLYSGRSEGLTVRYPLLGKPFTVEDLMAAIGV